MSSLTMVEAKLPPGFRFHPRDDELVCDYLMNKWNGCDSSSLLIDVDLNKCEPWDIPVCVGGKEWYFYSQRDRKYATGLRTNRATASGYWKATGKDRPVVRRGSLVGMRKTLVFYQGRAPKGKKTNWVMHEFRVEGAFAPPKFTCNSKQEDWVLCRVFYKSREVGSKCEAEQNDEGNNSMDETSSSTLPPLMDSYITFDQTQVNATTDASNNNNNNNNYQQVPCFSITSSSTNHNIGNHISIPNNSNYHMHHPNHNNNHNHNNNNNDSHINVVTNTLSGTSTMSIMPDDSTNLSPIACDRKVLEAVLTHFNKMDTSLPSPTLNGAPNLGDVHVSTSNQSYLSQLAMPPHHMWNHY